MDSELARFLILSAPLIVAMIALYIYAKKVFK